MLSHLSETIDAYSNRILHLQSSYTCLYRQYKHTFEVSNS